jgi:hypothetical protein
MANRLKHGASGNEADSMLSGNWAINSKTYGGGPTSQTGFYAGMDIPPGGFVIYAPGPNVRTAADVNELLFIAGKLGFPNGDIGQLFEWVATEPDVIILGKAVEDIEAEDLNTYLDFSNPASYPGTGDTFYNLATGSKGYVKNGVTFNPNEGSFETTGSNGAGGANAVGSRIDIETNGAGVDRFGKEDDFSIGLWVNLKANGERIFSTGSAGTGTGNSDACVWQFYLNDNRFFWWNSGGGSSNAITVDFPRLPVGQWKYVVVTYNYNENGNDVARVYIDGQLAGTGSQPTATHSAVSRRNQSNMQYTIGGGYYSSCTTRNTGLKSGGLVVYNKTLSAKQVQRNWKGQKNRFGL